MIWSEPAYLTDSIVNMLLLLKILLEKAIDNTCCLNYRSLLLHQRALYLPTYMFQLNILHVFLSSSQQTHYRKVCKDKNSVLQSVRKHRKPLKVKPKYSCMPQNPHNIKTINNCSVSILFLVCVIYITTNR